MARYYLVGIKGTGMASLALLLADLGNRVSGCDVPTVFSTDASLSSLKVDEGFDASLLPPCDMVIYSSAYSPSLPILERARKLSIPVCSYPRFLSGLTQTRESFIVAGTHGKTSVTAMTSYLLSRPARRGYPFFSLFGSTLVGGRLLPQGKRFFLLEGCEYRDHFLSYKARGALVTTIEWDHPDYFRDEEAVYQSFLRFTEGIERGGFLVICVDGPLEKRLMEQLALSRRDLTLIPYGFSSGGPFRIAQESRGLSLSSLPERFSLPSWSRAWVSDMVGASLLATAMLLDSPDAKLFLGPETPVTDEAFPTVLTTMLRDIATYPGTVGRMEKMGESGGVLFIDDYAHHPSQIRVVISALRGKYPSRPIVVLFTPHTASRTKALFPAFVSSLALADKVIVEETYASARGDGDRGEDSSLLLAEALKRVLRSGRGGPLSAVSHAGDDEEAVEIASSWLMKGDICVTMGAGNNRFLSAKLIEGRKKP